MRSELYADSKDVWKWTVALRHALHTHQDIFWVAMFRPDEQMHGDDEQDVPDALPELAAFFKNERDLIKHGCPPSLSRTTLVCHQLGVQMFANLDNYPTTEGKRRVYIERICSTLSARAGSQPYLVLVDPDDGIGQRSANGKQIHKSHLKAVWDRLKDGDTLGIVQFKHHRRDGDIPNSWHTALQKEIAEVLGVLQGSVVPSRWDNVCIYLIDRAVMPMSTSNGQES